jgi:L-asparaginase
MTIFNTGGTFNKRYDPIADELIVPADDEAVRRCLAAWHCEEVRIVGLIYKDSLDMDEADRARLAEAVLKAPQERVVVGHGTDTMLQSAAVLHDALQGTGKRVVLTGAMVPYAVDPVEASANLASALTAARFLAPGVYVAMHGLVLPYKQIRKNYARGVFERIER